MRRESNKSKSPQNDNKNGNERREQISPVARGKRKKETNLSQKEQVDLHQPNKNSHMNYSQNMEQSVDADQLFTSGLSLGSKYVVALNAYPNGVSISFHRPQDLKTLPSFEEGNRTIKYDPFFLRTRDTRELALPEGKFFIYRESYRHDLEKFFSTLKKKNLLDFLTVYLGVTNDPFHGFHKKFAQTSACLEILEKYKPARVIIQSRSRMLLTSLPTLKALGENVYCVIPFETRLEKAVSRYTPGQPRLEERLITAAGLRAQGIKITFCVSPLLPYGETSGDAWKFAEVLARYSDTVLLQPLCNGTRENELLLSKMAIAQKLEADKQMVFLRPHADEQLRTVLEKLSPKHLQIPELKSSNTDVQLKLFAA